MPGRVKDVSYRLSHVSGARKEKFMVFLLLFRIYTCSHAFSRTITFQYKQLLKYISLFYYK